MKKFSFVARDQGGRKNKGLVEANSSKEAVMLLRKRGMIVVDLRLAERGLFDVLKNIFSRVKSGQITTFTRQLATMIEAGLSLTAALHLLKKQFKGKMAFLVEDLLSAIEGGSSFSKALKGNEKVFGSVYIVSIRAGEEAGVLDKVLVRLADNLEKKREFVGRVKSAMIYPVIVLLGMTGVIFIVMTFVVPKMTSMYQEFGSDMPTPTRILISVSSFMSRFSWLFPFLVFALITLYRLLSRKQEFREKFDRWKLKVPIYGPLNQTLILTEITRTSAMLIQTGVPLVETLDIAANSAGNEVYRLSFEKAKDRVEKGFRFSEALAEENLIPIIVSQMVNTGEETGKLDDVLFKLSHYFQTEADQKVKTLTSAIEPLIMIVLGVGVGFLVFAVIMPIYNLTSQF